MATSSRPPGVFPATPIRKQRPPSECTALNRDQLRLLSESFARTGPEGIRPPSEGIISLIEIGLNLGTERDPVRLLKALCRTARNILGARQAILAVGEGNGEGHIHVLTSGVDDADAARVMVGPLQSAILGMTMSPKCVRGVNPDGVPASAGLPAVFPEVFAYLASPIRSLAQTYGWICFIDKTGGREFLNSDEELAATLASQIGRIYERNCLSAGPAIQTRDTSSSARGSPSGVSDLRASEELFRSVFDHTNVAMVLTDIDNRFFRVNAAFARMFGYTHAELLEMSMADLTHPDDVAESLAKREVLLSGDQQFFQIEKRYIHKSGRTIWSLTNVALMRGRSGEPLIYIGQVQDITDRKLAEASLCEEREFIRLVFDLDPNVIFVKDAEGRILLGNKAFASLCNTEPEKLIGRKPGVDLPAPREIDEYHRVEKQVIETRRPIHLDEAYTPADGEPRWFHMVRAPLTLPDGTTHLLGIGTDITERKRAEIALRASEARMHLILETASDAFIAMDAGGFVVDWNRKAETLFGWKRQETVGKRLSDLIIPTRFRSQHEHGLREFLKTGVGPVLHRSIELPALRRNGSEFPVEIRIWPTQLGLSVVFNALLRDLTENQNNGAPTKSAVDV